MTFAYVVTALTAIGMVVLLVVMLWPKSSRKVLVHTPERETTAVVEPADDRPPPTSLAHRVAELRQDIERLREEVASFRARAA